jgi:4-alpha-glucanotransferase
MTSPTPMFQTASRFISLFGRCRRLLYSLHFFAFVSEMDTALVNFRFAFRTISEDIQSVSVTYTLPKSKQDLVPRVIPEPIELTPDRKSGFHGDGKIRARVSTPISFQFTCTSPSREIYRSPWREYRLTAVPNDPVLISDAEESLTLPRNVTLRFKINYHTYFGQNVYVVGSLPELGLWDNDGGAKMTHSGWPVETGNGLFSDSQYNWQFDLSLPRAPAAISYKYIVKCDGSPPRLESGSLRYFAFDCADGPANYEMNDLWRSNEVAPNMVVKRVFDETSAREDQPICPEIVHPGHGRIRCVFLAFSTIVARARSLYVVGSINELGRWNPRKGRLLASTADLQASASVDLERNSFPFEYKHIALGGNNLIVWEPNENRKASVSKWTDPNVPTTVILDSWHLSFTGVAFHGAGVFVQLSAVKDGNSFDFDSMIKMARWASNVGFAAVHFIGMFDTTGLLPQFGDLPVSAFAINPLYLSLSRWGFEATAVDQVAILSQKLAFIWQRHRSLGIDEGELANFAKDNATWLKSYEEFCFTRSRLPPHEKAEFVRYVDVVQYLCYCQLVGVAAESRRLAVSIGVDLPFALAKDCAEMLSRPDLFQTNYWLGIPPSAENPIGTVLDAHPYNFETAASWFAGRLGDCPNR